MTPRSLALITATLILLAPLHLSAAQTEGPALAPALEATRSWAILADGRVKPLQTYARETALVLTGRESIFGLSSLEILWGYVLEPEVFKSRPLIRIDSTELKTELGFDPEQRRFAFSDLVANDAFRALAEQAVRGQRQGQDPSRLQRDALAAYAKLDRVAGLSNGLGLAIVPLLREEGRWTSPVELGGGGDRASKAVADGFVRLRAAHAGGDSTALVEAVSDLTAALRAVDPDLYPTAEAIDRELFSIDLNAFGKAWKLYLVGFLLVLVLGFGQGRWGYGLGMLLIALGFALHSVGIGYRWAIAGRAPVSDMYESLVFMGWGTIALGLILEAASRRQYLGLAAGLTGFLCLAFAENLPIDSAINPLVPVLANTAWLSVHVMTIMLGYSALALAMVLGHLGVLLALVQPGERFQLGALSEVLHKTLQVGLLFVAAGIICGAVWANESWGRYWGWDPKETWSLITFFVYLAIIHGRFAGWLREFGLAACSILGFLSVVMTYYGVNFILASGLHSYGFSEGGRLYAGLYAGVEIAFVTAAVIRYRSDGHAALGTGG